jgi:hypothetical protein
MRPLAAAGVAALLFGFVTLYRQGLAGVFDFGSAFISFVGVLALVQGVRYGYARRMSGYASTEVGTPEQRPATGVPGDEIDKELSRATGITQGASRRRTRLRERIREAATETLANDRGHSSEEVVDIIDDGQWTDDPVATAFLSESRSYPVSIHVRARLNRQSTFQYGMRRTLAAIDNISR